MMRGTGVEIILLCLMIPHDAHNCCIARFQGSPPLMWRMAFRRSVLVVYIHRGKKKKKKKTYALSQLM